MPRKPIRAEVIVEGEKRIVVTTYSDGEVVRTEVDPTKKPTRKPRKPFARVKVDHSRKRGF